MKFANSFYVIHLHKIGVGDCEIVPERSWRFPGENQSDRGELKGIGFFDTGKKREWIFAGNIREIQQE
jgi:hypothetical protein